MRPGLLALDLDGTLLDHNSLIPDAHRQAIAAVQAMNIPVALVTGRPVITTRPVWESLNLRNAAVCFNGTWLGHPDGEAIEQRPLAREDVHEIVQIMRQHEGVICCYTRDAWVMDCVVPRTRHWCQKYHTDAIHIDPGLIYDWPWPSPKVMFVCEPERLKVAVADLQAHFGPRYHVVASQEDRLEVHQPGITKAWGLSRLCELLGIERKTVWAAGDANNDQEMINWVGTGCAMGHAPAALKAVATHVLPPIEEHGLTAIPDLLRSALDA
jgi:Cof subfamily protein (haloacid dehalogenase superfamily)